MKLKETSRDEVSQKLLVRLEELFSQEGYQIVELHYAVVRQRAHFQIVLFHPEGVSLDNCAKLHRIAKVEIDYLQANPEGCGIAHHKDYNLEISSPGLRRRLQSKREFQIFLGQPVRCMIDGSYHDGALLGLIENEAELMLSLQISSKSNIENMMCNFPLEQVQIVELNS